MTITALPQATIHLLGSAQALTTPLSLVKELIDNSLDAKATSVDILISQNTLDKIEVRDNGHGIPQEDLDALGKRGHTSKLRSFEELKSIGGVSLGFRGEALASAVQLGQVSVTTKTDGETVATTVKLKAPGCIVDRSRTSHPVGTTVCVKNFIFNLPVRKQTALKAAPKTLMKIKELLQSYALARLNIRFSLKVMKENKGSWSFSPRPNDGIKEAVSQIIGRDAAAQCIEKSLEFPEGGPTSVTLKEARVVELVSESTETSPNAIKYDFVVELFLPKPDADPSKIGHGQYLSIDSRPVSCEKGTMRKLVTLFKYYVKESLSETSEKFTSPFLRLNIKCPVASYDPNVEPAKDDVLFRNEDHLLESIENIFREIYGERKNIQAINLPQSSSKKLDNFELLLARKSSVPPTSNLVVTSGDGAMPQSPLNILVSSPRLTLTTIGGSNSWEDKMAFGTGKIFDKQELGTVREKRGFDMSRELFKEGEGSQRLKRNNKFRTPGISQHSDQQEDNPKNELNPWLIAKMIAPVRQQSVQEPVTLLEDAFRQQTPNFSPNARRSSDPMLLDADVMSLSNAPTRQGQQPSPGDRPHIFPAPLNRSHPRNETSDGLHMARQRTRAFTAEPEGGLLVDDNTSKSARQNDFVSARNLPEFSLITPPSTRQQAPKRPRGLAKPFVSPLVNGDYVAQIKPRDISRQTTLFSGTQKSRPHAPTHLDLMEREPNPDLGWAMDFEQRKEKATHQNRKRIHAARRDAELALIGEELPQSSPHKNRYNAAIASLENNQPHSPIKNNNVVAKERFKTSLPNEDPRAYLMRRQHSMSIHPPKPGQPLRATRTKSTRMPLENIPPNEQLHNLVLTIPTNITSIREVCSEIAEDDMYMSSGNQNYRLVLNAGDAPALIRRIQAVANKWTETEQGKGYEFEYDFRDLLKIMV